MNSSFQNLTIASAIILVLVLVLCSWTSACEEFSFSERLDCQNTSLQSGPGILVSMAMSLMDCASQCSTSASCLAFTYSPPGGDCCLSDRGFDSSCSPHDLVIGARAYEKVRLKIKCVFSVHRSTLCLAGHLTFMALFAECIIQISKSCLQIESYESLSGPQNSRYRQTKIQ